MECKETKISSSICLAITSSILRDLVYEEVRLTQEPYSCQWLNVTTDIQAATVTGFKHQISFPLRIH